MMNRRRFFTVGAAGLTALVGSFAGGALFLNGEQFGALPPDLAYRNSAHFSGGMFQNTLPTPILSDGSSFAGALIRSLWAKKERPVPPVPIPSLRPDFSADASRSNHMIWFGHSSFYLKLGQRRFLLDPVFSPYAAPFSFSTRAFPGTNPVNATLLPEMDALLISHDHWDHLDFPTVAALKDKVKRVVCPLGVGCHFLRWGYRAENIFEGDWGDICELDGDVRIHILEARHYSGRSLSRNRALWCAFALEGHGQKIFYSGDTGYGPHFKKIASLFQGFDLALLDTGQYNQSWRFIHMQPEEAVSACKDLKARALFPAHVGKFALARHPWDEPFQRIARACSHEDLVLLTPKIGETVDFATHLSQRRPFAAWWAELASS